MNQPFGIEFPPEMADQEFAYLESRLRSEYRRRREEVTGRTYHIPRGEKYDRLWSKAAQLCRELEADPAEFMRIAFRHSWGREEGPFVNQLIGPAMRKVWAGSRPKEGEKDRFTKELQYTQYVWLRHQVRSPQRGLLFLLNITERERYSGWSRLVLAGSNSEVFAMWAPIAQEEVVGNPELRRWLEKSYPELLTRLLSPQ